MSLGALLLTCVQEDKVIIILLQLFEGLKAYRGVDDKIRLFRPELNMERMNLAAQRSGLPTFNGEELIKCVSRLVQIDQEWVPHSETSTLYIRPTLIGTEVRILITYYSSSNVLTYKGLPLTDSQMMHQDLREILFCLSESRGKITIFLIN